VENAVKHGIAKRVNPGRVSVTGFRRGDMLQLRVSNDAAEGGRRSVEGADHGIGLRATRSRLERIYGNQYRLDCSFDGADGTFVLIEFPLRTSAGAISTSLSCKE
jgi:LytS/YehU family sensor histidine kinase